jgi:Flp pilus assembly pilin Flp
VKNHGKRRSSQGGQAIVEYVLLLAIAVVSVGYLLGKLSGAFDTMTENTGAKLEMQVRTGSAPATIWIEKN